MRMAYLSNLLTVNSDTFCAYIRVQLGNNDDVGTGGNAPASVQRHYVAILDRSNCVTDQDRPIVRMMAEVK